MIYETDSWPECEIGRHELSVAIENIHITNNINIDRKK